MLALILDDIVHITILSYMHALIFRMLVAKKIADRPPLLGKTVRNIS